MPCKCQQHREAQHTQSALRDARNSRVNHTITTGLLWCDILLRLLGSRFVCTKPLNHHQRPPYIYISSYDSSIWCPPIKCGRSFAFRCYAGCANKSIGKHVVRRCRTLGESLILACLRWSQIDIISYICIFAYMQGRARPKLMILSKSLNGIIYNYVKCFGKQITNLDYTFLVLQFSEMWYNS